MQTEKQIPDGWYEVRVFLLFLNNSRNGSEFLDFNLEIRPDVEQPYKGFHVHVPFWRTHKTNQYNWYRFAKIANACNLPDREYNDLDDVMNAFKDQLVRVKIINKYTQGHNEVFHSYEAVEWQPSQFPKELTTDGY